MTNPAREDLLGYMLGALDAEETQYVEQQIKQDAELQEELENLESIIAPLEHLETPPAASAGLARRTIEFVAGRSRETTMLPAVELAPQSSGWSMTDFLVGAVTIAVLAAIAIPTLSYAKFNSRVTHCQNNLRQIGNALFAYQEMSRDQSFVPISTSPDNHFNVAGSYAPILKDCGLVEDDRTFYCNDFGGEIPSIEEIKKTSGPELAEMRRRMGGDYGYNLGYYSGGRYHAPRNRRRCNFAVLADSPSHAELGRSSINHGGAGQVVWFEDGSLRFMKDPVTPCGDFIFANDSGNCGPGLCCSDACIGPSSASPVAYTCN